jgi:hypothetical protein
MATKANAKQSPRQSANNRGGNDSFYIPPPNPVRNTPNEDSQMGFLIGLVSMMVVFALILPLIAFMYIDILEAKKETKRQQEQVQRLINKAEKNNE